jgi:nicotinamide mononucleotide transporter
MAGFIASVAGLMSLLEWVGFVTGVACVYLIVKERDVNWPIGVLNSVALAFVFRNYGLFAQAGLQVFYVAECFYGWYRWTRRDPSTGEKLLRISATGTRLAGFLAIAGTLGTAACFALFRATNDPAPFSDSLVTSLSLVAEYLLCVKLLEGWLVYLVADFISLALLALLGQWVTFGTYACFTVLCVLGVREWRVRLRATRAFSGVSAGRAP